MTDFLLALFGGRFTDKVVAPLLPALALRRSSSAVWVHEVQISIIRLD